MAGRPRKTWTDVEVEQFAKLCAIFCTKAEVCSILNLDKKTLDRLIAENFPDTPTWDEAFEYYSGTGRAALRRKMFELAVNEGDKSALIFMAKNYLGMSDSGLAGDRDAKRDEQTEEARARVRTIVGNSRWTASRAV